MKRHQRVFIDPSVTSPRMLSDAEMDDLSGGIILTAIVWATSCGEPLAIATVGTFVILTD